MNRMMWAVLLVKQKHQCQSFQAVTYKQPNLTVNYNLHSARLVLGDMELCLSFAHCFSLLSCRSAMRKSAKTSWKRGTGVLGFKKISGMRWK